MAKTLRGDVVIGRSLQITSVTEAERDALSSVVANQIIQVSDGSSPGLQQFDGTVWLPFGTSLQTLTDGAAVTWDPQSGKFADLESTQDATISATVANLVAGDFYTIVVENTDVASHDYTFFAGQFLKKDGTDLGAVTVPAGVSRAITFVSDGDALIETSQGDVSSSQVLTETATTNWDIASGDRATLTATGTVSALAAPTNGVAGQLYVLTIEASGADRTVTFDAAYRNNIGGTLSPAAIASGTSRVFTFYYDGTNYIQYADQPDPVATLVDATALNGSINWDVNDGTSATLTVGAFASVVLAAPSNTMDGQFLTLIVEASGQDVTIDFDAVYQTLGGVNLTDAVITDGSQAVYLFKVKGGVLYQVETGGGGALTVAAEVSAAATAVAGELLPVNTTGGAVTIQPPAGAASGDQFGVVDSRFNAATNNIYVEFDGAGYNVYAVAPDGGGPAPGGATDYVINFSGAVAIFTFIDATVGWVATQ